MRLVETTLDINPDALKVYVFSDWHIGDSNCDFKGIEELIDKVKNDENAVVICNGDLMNNATKTSISDSYAEQIPPMRQIELLQQLLEPIKSKIICMTQGNHEARTYYNDGVDLTQVVALHLGIEDKYCKEGGVVILRFGYRAKDKKQKILYSLYVTHGSGGGRKEGAKAIRVADMANIIDADVYVHSHSHLPFVMKEDFYRVHLERHSIEKVTKLFVNTSAQLNYGGYGQSKEFKPSSKDCPVIYLSNKHKKAYAML